MKTIFRLYDKNKTKIKSTIFDLINGNLETKQTKGLAYILKEYPDLVFDLIKKSGIKTPTFNKSKVSSIEVSAEKITTSNKRVDILIKIDVFNKPCLALIIEAKSIKLRIDPSHVITQVQGYLDDTEIPELNEYKKFPIILTKYKSLLSEDLISISWNDLIELMEKRIKKIPGSLLEQYYDFITEVDADMKYYEVEVLSLPAGNSIEFVEEHFIYECPDTKDYNYKKPIYLTFRKSGGGEMNALYKIVEIVILNPAIQSEVERIKDIDLDEKIKQRLVNYIDNVAIKKEEFEHRFYLLSKDERIELDNRPKPPKNNAKFTYYRLSDILTKTEVLPVSQIKN